MKALCFGSLNLDYIYRVKHAVAPGETLATNDFDIVPGGKGLNQSIALAKTGMPVYHAGCIGQEGLRLKEYLETNGVDVSGVQICDAPQGHAIVQVDDIGENCIIVYAGSNGAISKSQIDSVFGRFAKGDVLLVQNEINNLAHIVSTAYKKRMSIALNPSPCNDRIDDDLLASIDWLICNEGEFTYLGGCDDLDTCWNSLHRNNPNMSAIVTRGENGCIAFRAEKKRVQKLIQDGYEVSTVDTTGAGDTFLGFFLGSLYQNFDLRASLEMASMAAAIAVTRPGASSAIPELTEVKAALANRML